MTKRSAGHTIHKCSHGNIMANDAKAPVCTEYSHDMGSSPCLIEASAKLPAIFNQPESIESTPLSWAQTRVLAKGGALSMEVVNHHTGSQRDEKGLKYKVNNKHDGQMEFIVALQTLTHWQLAFGTHWYPIMCLHVSTERMVGKHFLRFSISVWHLWTCSVISISFSFLARLQADAMVWACMFHWRVFKQDAFNWSDWMLCRNAYNCLWWQHFSMDGSTVATSWTTREKNARTNATFYICGTSMMFCKFKSRGPESVASTILSRHAGTFDTTGFESLATKMQFHLEDLGSSGLVFIDVYIILFSSLFIATKCAHRWGTRHVMCCCPLSINDSFQRVVSV